MINREKIESDGNVHFFILKEFGQIFKKIRIFESPIEFYFRIKCNISIINE
jgi:hypothetical protein